MKEKIAILGATGTVGQKMIAMLQEDSHFEISQLIASEKNIGKKYGEVVRWREATKLNENIKTIKLESIEDVSTKYALSSLPSNIAREWELKLSSKGVNIISNASAYRMQADTPLLIPEINSADIDMIKDQQTTGKIITNPNCSTVFLCLALAPILDITKVVHVNVSTMQAVSGAGYPGVASIDIIDNIVPTIDGEEEKMETEPLKILKRFNQDFSISAQCHRVPVKNGHTLAIEVEIAEPIERNQVIASYTEWNTKHKGLFNLEYMDRGPEVRHLTEFDQATYIGKVKLKSAKRITLLAMGHNLVRGAAGAAKLNLELLHNELGK